MKGFMQSWIATIGFSVALMQILLRIVEIIINIQPILAIILIIFSIANIGIAIVCAVSDKSAALKTNIVQLIFNFIATIVVIILIF